MKPVNAANLVYVNDTRPGISRSRRGKGFAYRDAAGRWLRDADELRRIRKLAIPPAYTEVWICPLPNGHLQATGRDARGRKQYRYHADWRLRRDEDKYDRLAAFGRALPRIRARVARDLGQRAGNRLTRTLVLATMVRLLDTTCIRVGSDRYARSNGSFGLTTLRNRHARVDHNGTLRLSFQGKGGVRQQLTLDDPRIARLVRRLQDLPGQELFQYQDSDGEPHTIGSSDLNDYLSEAAGARFTAKDFRTWHGTVVALECTRCAFDTAPTEAGDRRPADPGSSSGASGAYSGAYSITRMLDEVARRLGNTPAVCRKAYIHPDVLGLGAMLCSDEAACTRLWSELADLPATPRRLQPAERRLLKFLGRRQRSGRRSG